MSIFGMAGGLDLDLGPNLTPYMKCASERNRNSTSCRASQIWLLSEHLSSFLMSSVNRNYEKWPHTHRNGQNGSILKWIKIGIAVKFYCPCMISTYLNT